MHSIAVFLVGYAAIAAAMQTDVTSLNSNGDLSFVLNQGVMKISGLVKDPEVPFYGEFRFPHLSKTLTLSVPTLQSFLMPSTSVNGKCVRGRNTMAVGVPLTGAAITLQCPWVDAEWFISINVPAVSSKAKRVGIGMELLVSDIASAVTFPAAPPSGTPTSYYLKLALCVVAIVSIAVMSGIACAMVQKRRADNIDMAERIRELEERWLGYQRMTESDPTAAPTQVYMCPHGRIHAVPLPTLQQPLFVD